MSVDKSQPNIIVFINIYIDFFYQNRSFGKWTIPAQGTQKFYEKDVYKTVMKSAKTIGAKTSFDGNYLKVALPAIGFSLPLYAGEGKKPTLFQTDSTINSQREQVKTGIGKLKEIQSHFDFE